MGKGDKRTRRGKIYRGSHGATRPKASKIRKQRKVARRQAAQAANAPRG